MLLILTNKEDFTADFMIQKLLEMGMPYFRLNSDDLYNIDYEFSIKGKEIVRRIKLQDKVVELDKLKSVWYRRKISPSLSNQVVVDEQHFAVGELQHFVEGLILDSTLSWVNPIAATDIGEKKMLQLRLAHKIGFTVPDTVVSNDPAKLNHFISNHLNNTICKPIYHGLFYKDNKRFAVYTHKISPNELYKEKVIPTLLQMEVPKGNDIRLTIIGKDVYPVEIYSPEGLPLDWRQQGSKVSFKNCSVPSEVERMCFALLKQLNLVYGAFDFVRTPNGEWYFLEVNPTGEWAWLEIELSLPMSDSFIRVFNA